MDDAYLVDESRRGMGKALSLKDHEQMSRELTNISIWELYRNWRHLGRLDALGLTQVKDELDFLLVVNLAWVAALEELSQAIGQLGGEASLVNQN